MMSSCWFLFNDFLYVNDWPVVVFLIVNELSTLPLKVIVTGRSLANNGMIDGL